MKKFNAFSLIEMLLTLVILTIVFLLTTKTLTTLIQVSTITKYKTMTRNEADFAMEFIERILANSNVKREGDDIFIYNTSQMRAFNPATGTIIPNPSVPATTLLAEYNSTTVNGDVGTEFHVKPYKYPGWMCVGFFIDSIDSERGYLLKRSVDTLPNHMSCFDSTNIDIYPIMVLNSENINVNDFKISFHKSDLINNIFYVDMEFEPLYWTTSSSPIEKAVIRQSVVTTQGLTWY
jgi:prepilin-type N-terminal cleavage/methylation domain-containing protein